MPTDERKQLAEAQPQSAVQQYFEREGDDPPTDAETDAILRELESVEVDEDAVARVQDGVLQRLDTQQPTRYRKKPVVIDAFQWQGDWDALMAWMDSLGFTEDDGPAVWEGADAGELVIPTLEGEMRASLSDWIICGVAQELYPCKPNIFAATYEPAAPLAVGEREGLLRGLAHVAAILRRDGRAVGATMVEDAACAIATLTRELAESRAEVERLREAVEEVMADIATAALGWRDPATAAITPKQRAEILRDAHARLRAALAPAQEGES